MGRNPNRLSRNTNRSRRPRRSHGKRRLSERVDKWKEVIVILEEDCNFITEGKIWNGIRAICSDGNSLDLKLAQLEDRAKDIAKRSEGRLSISTGVTRDRPKRSGTLICKDVKIPHCYISYEWFPCLLDKLMDKVVYSGRVHNWPQ